MEGKYYVFCKSSVWEKGISYGLDYNQNTLVLKKSHGENINGKRIGVYISSSLDTLEKETLWNRILIEYELPEECSFKVTYYSSDDKKLYINGEIEDVDEIINSKEIKVLDKISILNSLWNEEYNNPKEILLHKASGRFLWFKIELISFSEYTPVIKKIKVEYPRNSYIDLIPEVFRKRENNSDFLIRFIAIYQSIVSNLDENIVNISKYYEPTLVDGEYLQWLSKWVGIEEEFIWEKQRLKRLIKESYKLYKQKGTKEGLSRIIEIYTDYKPIIVENYEVMEEGISYVGMDEYKRLYGKNPYLFTVMIDENAVKDRNQLMGLKRLVDQYKPAHTLANIVLLKNQTILGSYTYLNVNTVIDDSNGIKLDGTSALLDSTVI